MSSVRAGTPAIEVTALCKRYGSLQALDNVDLRVEAGEFFALLGPNGAGKTTTIKMLCTLLEPSGGQATVCGYDVVQQADAVRQHLGAVLTGERSIYWKLTGRENLAYFAALYHIPPALAKPRIDELLTRFELTKRADELISETYAHLYRIPLTGLRFFTVYGPWGRPEMAVWMFTRDILEGRPITVFNKGQMKRDFTYIDDIISGVVAALDNPPLDDGLTKPGGSKAPHRLYNIGNNRSEALMDLIATIENACGKKAEIDFQPMQAGDVYETHADIDDIARDLGYAPTTPISVGIPRFVAWYRQYRGL